MSIVGYARGSSVGQSLDVQLDKLKPICDKVFQDKKSRTTTKRLQLKACLNYLRKNDILVVTKLDRLARSTFHLTQIAENLKNQGIGLRVLDQAIDTTTPTGKLLFDALAAISEFETAIRKERQTEGIDEAKKRGVRFGRRPKLTKDQIAEMRRKRKEGTKIRTLMAEYGLSTSSVYRLLGPSDGRRR